MTVNVRASLAVGRYAITLPLVRGEISVDGIDVVPFAMPSPERHWRMLRHQEFDVCEISIAGFLRAFEKDPTAWTAIPVFPHRRFRHGYVFVADPELVGHPERLAGRRIGLRVWGNSASLWLRGLLQDEYGVDLRSVAWVTESHEHVPGGGLDDFSIERREDKGLVELLLDGEIDALIYPEKPVVPEGRTGVIYRLFADPKAAEQRFFEQTGIFPIMHTVALRRDFVEENPWAPLSVLKAFEQAKGAALHQMRNPRWAPLAWAEDALDEQERLLGPDPWPYGLEPNQHTLETAIRYAHGQGLIASGIDAEDLFWPSTVHRPPTYRAAGTS